jgi:hypothetical protein
VSPQCHHQRACASASARPATLENRSNSTKIVVSPSLKLAWRICSVDRNYDLFEMLSDGVPVWRGAIHGREDALRKLEELAKQTRNEVRVMHEPTKTVIAVMNTPKT